MQNTKELLKPYTCNAERGQALPPRPPSMQTLYPRRSGGAFDQAATIALIRADRREILREIVL